MSQSSLGGSLGESGASIGEKTAEQRTDYLTNKQGDALGANYTVPKGNFAHFLGFDPPTLAEKAGTAQVNGRRAIELSLQGDFQAVGLKAAQNGASSRNQFVASGAFDNKPGREQEGLKDGLDSIRASDPEKHSMESKHMGSSMTGEAQYAGLSSMEKSFVKMNDMQKASRNDNMRMMEMQYKMQALSKEEGIISNLMKVRHDAISRTIRGNGQ